MQWTPAAPISLNYFVLLSAQQPASQGATLATQFLWFAHSVDHSLG